MNKIELTKEELNILNKEAELIIKHLLFIYKKGRFPMIKVLGHPGTGKSGACMRIAELLNLRLHGTCSFDPQYIVDNLEDLVEVIIRTKPSDKRVIVIEEMSSLFNNRRFMGKDNVAANKIFDTMRKKGMIVIGNYPIDKTVDSHIEKLFNVSLEVINLDKINKKYFLRAIILQTNPGTGKTYTHLFKNDRGFDVRFFNLSWCDPDTFAAYDEGKDVFMKELYENILNKKRAERAKEVLVSNQIKNGLKPLTENQKQVMQALGSGKKLEDIAKATNRSVSAIRTARDLSFKKGYKIEDFQSVDGSMIEE